MPVGVSRGLHSTHPPTQPLLFPPDSTNSSENMYTIMNPIGPGAGRANVSGGRCASPDGDPSGEGRPEPHAALCPQFPLGPSPEGPMASMSTMEPHHVNGSLGEWLGATYWFHWGLGEHCNPQAPGREPIRIPGCRRLHRLVP